MCVIEILSQRGNISHDIITCMSLCMATSRILSIVPSMKRQLELFQDVSCMNVVKMSLHQRPASCVNIINCSKMRPSWHIQPLLGKLWATSKAPSFEYYCGFNWCVYNIYPVLAVLVAPFSFMIISSPSVYTVMGSCSVFGFLKCMGWLVIWPVSIYSFTHEWQCYEVMLPSSGAIVKLATSKKTNSRGSLNSLYTPWGGLPLKSQSADSLLTVLLQGLLK